MRIVFTARAQPHGFALYKVVQRGPGSADKLRIIAESWLSKDETIRRVTLQISRHQLAVTSGRF